MKKHTPISDNGIVITGIKTDLKAPKKNITKITITVASIVCITSVIENFINVVLLYT